MSLSRKSSKKQPVTSTIEHQIIYTLTRAANDPEPGTLPPPDPGTAPVSRPCPLCGGSTFSPEASLLLDLAIILCEVSADLKAALEEAVLP